MELRGEVVAFGDWELDFRRGELRCAGSPVDVQPTPLRLLLYLAEHRDRVVSRSDLLGAVWRNVAVGDEALTTAIGEARHAVGDDGATQRVIRTYKGRGYRFVAKSLRAAPAERARAFPPTLAEAARSPAVGRAAETRALTALWDAARSGSRRIALVSGEAGIGKTVLASRIASHAAQDGGIVAYGRFDEDHAGPFQGWARALRSADLEALLPQQRPLERRLGPLVRLLPELGDGRRDPIAHDPLAHAADLAALGEAVDAALGRLSDERPLLLVLDDLHWADPASLLLLRQVARSGRAGRTLIVGTLRDSDLAASRPLRDLLADLHREHATERLSLRGFDEREVGELISARVGFSPPAAFVRAVREKTSGNPFFVVELLRHLGDLGALRTGHGDGGLTPGDVDAFGIPTGVREVVSRRLEQLSREARDALEVASVAGQEFEAALIGSAGRLKRDELLGALDEASAAQLVTPLRPDAARFGFVHAIVRHAIYAGLSAVRRASLHWAIADALEARDDGNANGAVAIAHHRAAGVLAGDAATASAAGIRAAERLGEIGAYEQSEAEARRALALVSSLEAEADLRQRAYMALGRAQLVLGSRDFTASFEAAEQIAAARGWSQRAAAAVVASTEIIEFTVGHDAMARPRIEAALRGVAAEPTRERALLLVRLIHCIVAQASGEPVDAIAEEALALARAARDDQVMLEVLHGVALAQLGRPACLAALREGAALAPRGVGAAQRHRALRLVTGDLASRGARSSLDAQLESFRSAGSSAPVFAAELLVIGVSLMLADGRFAEVGTAIEALSKLELFQGSDLFVRDLRHALRAEQGDVRSLDRELLPALEAEGAVRPAFRAAGAAVLAELGRLDEARARLRALSRDDFEALPRDWSWPLSLRYLAEAAAHLADRRAARALEPQLAGWSGTLLWAFGFRLPVGAADRALGQVLAAQRRWPEASAAFGRALALEEGFGAKALAQRTRLWWARALRDEGRDEGRAQALTLARECLAFARHADMRGLADAAEALATELAG